MKQLFLVGGVLSLLLSFYACSDMEELQADLSLSSDVTIRAAGDEKYDVLGYGYDVTGEYLHPMSVRNPVLDVKKYEQEYSNRLITGTSSFGYDQMFYGYSASDYTKDIINETNVNSSMSYGNEKVDSLPYFSGNITDNNYLKTEYAYSDKYSFASVDAVRNRKYIRINDEVIRMSQYLSQDFIEDLERLSPDRIVERYGTHVLTDFIIGGRYKLMYRSVITNTKDTTHKKKTVSSGLKAALEGIGFSLNISRTVQTDESLVKDNQSKELYVLFYGGSGASLKFDLEKGMPTGVDIQSWENSVNLGNTCLNEINWKETYPIYEFVSDPIKKERLRTAVKNYIENHKLTILPVKPVFQYYQTKYIDHYYRVDWAGNSFGSGENDPGWSYERIAYYILREQVPGSVPLYEYYHTKYIDHYYDTKWTNRIGGGGSDPGWTPEGGVVGYVFTKQVDGTQPVYQFYHSKYIDHFYTMEYSGDVIGGGKDDPGWRFERIQFYAYPL